MTDPDQPPDARAADDLLEGDERMGIPPAWSDLLPGGTVPSDWNDPSQLVHRTECLVATAHQAAEMMTELMLRLPDERASRCDLLAEGSGTMVCVDALFALHKALVRYQAETLRFDGDSVASDSIARNYGAGTAMLTMQALDGVREAIALEMRRHWDMQHSASVASPRHRGAD
jgi:hypothetical protein